MSLLPDFFLRKKKDYFGLKDYIELVKNAVYVKGENVVIATRHYKVPPHSIINYLQNGSKKLLQNQDLDPTKLKISDKMLLNLPSSYLKFIGNAHPLITNNVLSCIPENYFGGNNYLRMVMMELSLKDQKKIKECDKDNLLEEVFRKSRKDYMWSMELILDESYKLPSVQIPKFLIQSMTSVSIPLYIQPARYPISDALLLIDSLYKAKGNPQKLQNRNKNNLEQIAIETMANFSQSLAFSIAQNFSNKINEKNKSVFSKQEIWVPNRGGGNN